MNIEIVSNDDRKVSTTVTPEALAMIDHYADSRKLYRSNWFREAISEKLEREVKAETGLDLSDLRVS